MEELILSGSGTNFMAMLGALDIILENHSFRDIKRLVGTSMGSIICFLLMIGYTPASIYKVAKHYSFESLHDIGASDLLSFFDNLGLMTGERILKVVQIFMKYKDVSENITFQQLYELSKKKFAVVVYCIDDMQSEEFSYEKTPKMQILTSIQMSISIPILFRPVRYNNKLYVDGGIYDNLPIRFCKNPEKALACMLCTDVFEYNSSNMDILQYIHAIVKGIVHRFTRMNCAEANVTNEHRHILYIKIPYQPVMNFEISQDIKQKLFETGQAQATVFCSVQSTAQVHQSS